MADLVLTTVTPNPLTLATQEGTTMQISLGLGLTATAVLGQPGFSPVNAIRQRDGSAIRDRAGNFIEVRA